MVARLLEFYDPYSPLDLWREAFFEHDWKPRRYSPERERKNAQWHYGRIEYFVRRFKRGSKIEPIEVDMTWCRHSCTGLVVLDGHHRLCAADLAGVTEIPADCGGVVEVIHWLEGRHDHRPEL